ncbi:MAG TPA: MBOAT family protein, partial [Verrucomicrobiae bacterium]|nr:MBOAT family protein [Verrucomicrobiae bacterium]
LVRRFHPLLCHHGFETAALQTPWVRDRIEAEGKEMLAEMRLITPSGQIFGGADALIEIAHRIWWARPLSWVLGIPPLRFVSRKAYGWVARNRGCLGGACRIRTSVGHPSVGAFGWTTAALPGLLALVLGGALPAWVRMWTTAFALFVGAKWITILGFVRDGHRISAGRLLAYGLLWPGMDARAFCGAKINLPTPAREWALAVLNILFGAGVLWLATTRNGMTDPLATGWIGMVGIVLLLHFGFFHLLSLFWRAMGINARPLMHYPIAAPSLDRFWGTRWNTAFSDLTREHLWKPLTRRMGGRFATLTAFLISGALHELVISVPARGGYGLPTLFFGVQGTALLFERSKAGAKLGIRSGLNGWLFTLLVAGFPAVILFHPPFIHNVILPMLHAIGSI